MGKVHNFLKKLDDFNKHYHSVKTEKNKMADTRRANIANTFSLSQNQKDKIDKLFIENYGKKIPYDWHRYYSSYTGHFDEKYIPELIFIPEIERRFVPDDYAQVFSNKNILPVLVHGIDNVRTADIIISCECGILRNSNMEFISNDEAERILYNIGNAFIKPSRDSNSGKGCAVINIQNGIDQNSGRSVKEILNKQGKYFNIQELLVNCKSIRDLHPESINTFRITTYIWNNKIYHFPLLLRIAQGKNNLDNAHAGGMFIGVSDEGKLRDCAYTEFQDRYYTHPDTKIKFDGYEIKETPKMIEAVERLHQRLPQIGMISWDVTVDDKGSVVIVEINLQGQTIWMSQMSNGKGAFGENTADILKWIAEK